MYTIFKSHWRNNMDHTRGFVWPLSLIHIQIKHCWLVWCFGCSPPKSTIFQSYTFRRHMVDIYGIANHDTILFLHVFIRISFKFLFICVIRYVMSNYSFCLMWFVILIVPCLCAHRHWVAWILSLSSDWLCFTVLSLVNFYLPCPISFWSFGLVRYLCVMLCRQYIVTEAPSS